MPSAAITHFQAVLVTWCSQCQGSKLSFTLGFVFLHQSYLCWIAMSGMPFTSQLWWYGVVFSFVGLFGFSLPSQPKADLKQTGDCFSVECLLENQGSSRTSLLDIHATLCLDSFIDLQSIWFGIYKDTPDHQCNSSAMDIKDSLARSII